MTFDFHPLITLITIVVIVGAILNTVAYLVYAERKISAWMQDRVGPNRVGPYGLLQSFTDVGKLLLKEDIIPSHVDRLFYLLAPAVSLATALLAFAVVPFGRTTTPPARAWPQTVAEETASPAFAEEVATYNDTYQFVIAPHVDIGFVFLFAVSSLAVYGIILGGWSSNNKYSFLGALRSSAQIISYEIPMGLSVLGVVLLSQSLNAERIINQQVHHGWNLFFQPLAFLLFLTSIYAECNRLPFDLPEAEQELVGGYHTEYSALKFGLYFLSEYTHLITTSFLVVTLFLGGWNFPWIAGLDGGVIVKLLVFAGKMLAFILLAMLIRWTIPRFRFDQLMGLAWKVFIPLALVNLVCVMIVVHLDWRPPWVLLPVSLLLLVGAGLLAMYQPKEAPRAVRVTRGHEQVEVMVR